MQCKRIEGHLLEIGAATDLGVSSKEIQQFWYRHWQRVVALTRPDFYTWQFLTAPTSAGKDTVRVAVLANRLVGVLGVTDRPFVLDGEKLPCAELTTWIIADDMKGKGIGLRMIQDVMSNYAAIIGSGIADASLKFFMQLNVDYMRLMPRFFRVYDVDAVRPYARITPFGEKLALVRAPARCGADVNVDSVSAADLGEIAEERLAGKNHALRDSAHLHWRYDQHPTYRYEAYRINDRSGIVLRRDSIPGMDFAHVLDVFCSSDARNDIVAFIDEYADAHSLAAVDFSCTDSEITAALRASGWFSTVDDQMFQLLNLFHPRAGAPASVKAVAAGR